MAADPIAAEAAMTACLGRLGFNAPSIAYLRLHGVTSADTFAMISFSSMTSFLESINKPGAIAAAIQQAPIVAPAAPAPGRGAAGRGGAGRGAVAAAAAAAAVAPIVLPYVSTNGLKALRAWIEYRRGRNEAADPDLFDNEVLMTWLRRVDVLKDLKTDPPSSITSPPKFKNLNNWTIWEQQFRTYVSQFRSNMCGAPLTYVFMISSSPSSLKGTAGDSSCLSIDVEMDAQHF
jgi:hypothetical protein